MILRATSCAYYQPDGLVCFIDGSNDSNGLIIRFSNLSIMVAKANVHDSFALDVGLLDRVFKTHIVPVKSIPHNCQLAFSQALQTALYKDVTQPGFIEA